MAFAKKARGSPRQGIPKNHLTFDSYQKIAIKKQVLEGPLGI
jgi:hypothetical protein